MAENEFSPVAPGEMLKQEFLAAYGLSQNRLAKAIGISPNRIAEIVNKTRRGRSGANPGYTFYQTNFTLNPSMAGSSVTIGTSSISACAASIRSNGSL
jgi:hypothetical protein